MLPRSPWSCVSTRCASVMACASHVDSTGIYWASDMPSMGLDSSPYVHDRMCLSFFMSLLFTASSLACLVFSPLLLQSLPVLGLSAKASPTLIIYRLPSYWSLTSCYYALYVLYFLFATVFLEARHSSQCNRHAVNKCIHACTTRARFCASSWKLI